MKQLRESCIEALAQIAQLLNTLAPDQYCQRTPFSSSTVGAHVRHVVDHFLALRTALDNESHQQCRINYNRRHRDSDVEARLLYGLDILRELSAWLFEANWIDRELEIETEIALSSSCNKVIKSTLSRELCYLINHTVHHAAYMGVIAKQLGVQVKNEMGVAPATRTYLRAVEGR